MKRIIMMSAAVVMAMLLGACGQKEPKPPEVTTPDATMDQPKSQEQMPAAVAPKEGEQQPAEENSMPVDKSNTSASASDVVNPTANTVEGASANPHDKATKNDDMDDEDDEDDDGDDEDEDDSES